jgi:hypothetical protein
LINIFFKEKQLTSTTALVSDLVVTAWDREVVSVAALKASICCACQDLATAEILDVVHSHAVHVGDGATRTERGQFR